MARANSGAWPPLRGLYAVTPDGIETAMLLELVDAAIAGGADVIQYRDKGASGARRLEVGRALLALCRGRRVPLIVNDHLELALAIGADGVHVGSSDGDVENARTRLGEGPILGASCYADLARATTSVAAGCDYVAFGSVFSSQIKPGAVNAPLALFREFKAGAPSCPAVGIGGINAKNIGALIAAGADAAASIQGVFDPPQRDAVFANARRLSLPFFESS
jgi:thiamine-phosphate pyrophosphorylase